MTDYIYLINLNINHFTLFDAELYCKILNINPDNVAYLDLCNNNLTDISGVSIFKNLEWLDLDNNRNLIGLSLIKNLVNLNELRISGLNLTDELKTVNILKNLTNLNSLGCYNTFKTVDIRKELKGIYIYD